ncbi:MAG: hypothetical protein AB7P17_09585 [Nitrospirales bacterium]
MMKGLFKVPPGEEAVFLSSIVTIGLAILVILLLLFWPELFIGDIADYNSDRNVLDHTNS